MLIALCVFEYKRVYVRAFGTSLYDASCLIINSHGIILLLFDTSSTSSFFTHFLDTKKNALLAWSKTRANQSCDWRVTEKKSRQTYHFNSKTTPLPRRVG